MSREDGVFLPVRPLKAFIFGPARSLVHVGRDGPRTIPGTDEPRTIPTFGGSTRRNTLLKQTLSLPIKVPAQFPAFMGFFQHLWDFPSAPQNKSSQVWLWDLSIAVGSVGAGAELQLILCHRRCRAEGREPSCPASGEKDADEKPFAPSGVHSEGSNLRQQGKVAAFGPQAPRVKQTFPSSARGHTEQLSTPSPRVFFFCLFFEKKEISQSPVLQQLERKHSHTVLATAERTTTLELFIHSRARTRQGGRVLLAAADVGLP